MCLDNLVRRASALIPRATEADRIIHYENTVETALPFSRMAIRRPKLFRVLYFGALGGALSVPWMVIRYQLGKQGKWIGWYDLEN